MDYTRFCVTQAVFIVTELHLQSIQCIRSNATHDFSTIYGYVTKFLRNVTKVLKQHKLKIVYFQSETKMASGFIKGATYVFSYY